MATIPPPAGPDTSPVEAPAEPTVPPAETGPMPGDLDMPSPAD